MTEPTHHTLHAEPVIFSMLDPRMQAPMPKGFAHSEPGVADDEAEDEIEIDDGDDAADDDQGEAPAAAEEAPESGAESAPTEDTAFSEPKPEGLPDTAGGA